jgi:hypothetical protein
VRVLRRQPLGGRRIELQLGGVDQHVGALELAHLAQLRVRERGLSRTAAPDDHDLLDARLREDLDRVVRGVGYPELGVVERDHPRHVDRDVAVADYDHPLRTEQVELEVAVVGMAVVPGDELGRGVRSVELLAGNSEVTVGRRANRVDDRVVAAPELVPRDVLAELDAAVEPEALVLGGAVERLRDGLDLRVIGGHARPHEPVWRRQAVEQVDAELRLVGGEQLGGGVEPRRTGADDRNAVAHGPFDASRGGTDSRCDLGLQDPPTWGDGDPADVTV